MVDAKSYLKVTTAFTCFIFMTIAAINYIVDPYWQFDFAPSHTIVGLNNQISESSLSHFHSELMLERQKKVLQQSSADTVFIGSSRSLFGLNTCGYNNIQKSGMFGITSSQTIQLFETALNNLNYRHVYIELGNLTNNVEVEHTSLTPLEALFSVHVLTRSLSNFVASMRLPQHKDPLCEVSRSSNSTVMLDGKRFEDEREKYRSIADQLTSYGLKQVVEKIARQCRNSSRTEDNLLNVVIYFAPLHPSLISYEILPRFNQIVQDSIIHNDFPKRCSIEAYIFQPNRKFYQNENWFDLTHYKPNIGNIFLRNMLTGT
jgi:hypothetical protein